LLAVLMCQRAYPKMQAALEGVATMLGPAVAWNLHLTLCLPEGMPETSVSVSFVSQMELGRGKGPGSKMVETLTKLPGSFSNESNAFGRGGVMVHPTLEDCIDYLKCLREHCILVSEGQAEAARNLSDRWDETLEER
ncbi:hypothetical protein KIPB_012890, partial [Kipferlia bialata]